MSSSPHAPQMFRSNHTGFTPKTCAGKGFRDTRGGGYHVALGKKFKKNSQQILSLRNASMRRTGLFLAWWCRQGSPPNNEKIPPLIFPTSCRLYQPGVKSVIMPRNQGLGKIPPMTHLNSLEMSFYGCTKRYGGENQCFLLLRSGFYAS